MELVRYVSLLCVLNFSVHGSPSTLNSVRNFHADSSSSASSYFPQLQQTWHNMNNNGEEISDVESIDRMGEKPPGQGYESVADQSGFDKWVGGTDETQKVESSQSAAQEDNDEASNDNDVRPGDVFQDDDKNQIERKIQLGRNMEEADAALVSNMAQSEKVPVLPSSISQPTGSIRRTDDPTLASSAIQIPSRLATMQPRSHCPENNFPRLIPPTRLPC